MVDHCYPVRLKTPRVQHVIASTVQLYGDHLFEFAWSAYRSIFEILGSELEHAAQHIS